MLRPAKNIERALVCGHRVTKPKGKPKGEGFGKKKVRDEMDEADRNHRRAGHFSVPKQNWGHFMRGQTGSNQMRIISDGETQADKRQWKWNG